MKQTTKEKELNEETAVEVPALVKIVQASGLEQTKANYILEKFQDYFRIAADWENKAKSIVVTSADQTAEMKMAKAGRLFLKAKRVDIENARKELKEQSLREGKAIDGIANVLKALIQPTEEYLDRQEHFVELREEEERNRRASERIAEVQSIGFHPDFYDLKNMPEEDYRRLIDGERAAIQARVDILKKQEEDRIAKEKAEAEERERMKAENERLRKEREEAEAKRKVVEDQAKKERAEAEAREKKLKAEQEEKLRKEREERERAEKELKARKDAEAKAKKDAEEAKRKAERAPDKAKLIALADTIDSIPLPAVVSAEANLVSGQARGLLAKVSAFLRERAESL